MLMVKGWWSSEGGGGCAVGNHGARLWSLVEAAAVPVFLTAFYRLSVMLAGKSRQGRKVLVHAHQQGCVWQQCRWRGIGGARGFRRRESRQSGSWRAWVLTTIRYLRLASFEFEAFLQAHRGAAVWT